MKTIVLDLETDFTIKTMEDGDTVSDFGRPFNRDSRIALWCVNDDGRYLLGHSALELKLYLEGLITTHGKIAIVAHNAKYEGLWLKAIGMDMSKIRLICTLLREYIIGCGTYKAEHCRLDDVAVRYGGTQKIDLVGMYFKRGITSSNIPLVLLERYVRGDVGNTTLIYNGQMQNPDLRRQKAMLHFAEDVLETLVDMEYDGLAFNDAALDEVRRELDRMQADAERRLMKAVRAVCGAHTDELLKQYEGKGKLIDSSQAMSKIVYSLQVKPERKEEFKQFASTFRPHKRHAAKDLKLAIEQMCEKLPYGAKVVPETSWMSEAQVIKNTYIGATGFVANGKLMQAYLDHGDPNEKQKELLEAFLEYSKIDTWKTGSLGQMLKGLADDNFIHGSFNQVGTSTMRFSSNNPNLQNFPREGTVPLKKLIKSRYEDGVIVQADFGQLEFRVVGWIAGDKQLVDDVEHDFDIHTHTAKMAFKDKFEKSEGKERKALRQRAKTKTFAFQYGAMPKTPDEQAIFEAFYGKYNRISIWQEKTVGEIARKKEYVCPLTGKVFRFEGATMDNRIRWATKAKNYPVQFLSAVVAQCAQRYAWELIKQRGKDDMKLVIQVHDSLVVDCKAEAKEDAARILVQAMTKVSDKFEKYFGTKVNVPLTTDLEYGTTYLGGEKLAI